MYITLKNIIAVLSYLKNELRPVWLTCNLVKGFLDSAV